MLTVSWMNHRRGASHVKSTAKLIYENSWCIVEAGSSQCHWSSVTVTLHLLFFYHSSIHRHFILLHNEKTEWRIWKHCHSYRKDYGKNVFFTFLVTKIQINANSPMIYFRKARVRSKTVKLKVTIGSMTDSRWLPQPTEVRKWKKMATTQFYTYMKLHEVTGRCPYIF